MCLEFSPKLTANIKNVFYYLCFKARDVKIMRPMYGVELFDGETARFEVELSEDDVHSQWSLNGEVLIPSSVRL